MKKLKIFIYITLSFNLTAQTNVFDCNNYTLGVSQNAIDNSNGEYFNSCINFTDNNNYDFNTNDNNTVTASQRIHILNGQQADGNKFHAGNYSQSGKMHLKIGNDIPTFDVLAMNYDDLNAVIKYEKFELGIVLPQEIQEKVNDFVYNNGTNPNQLNPYLDWETQVYCTFSHSSGTWYQDIQGFFYQDFNRNLDTDSWDLKPGQENATDYPSFRVRFSPPLVGDWLAQVHIKVNGVEVETSPFFGFNVYDTGSPGFVKVHENKKNLKQDDKLIFPVGACLPFPGENSGHFEFSSAYDRSKKVSDYTSYNDEITNFANQGGKYTRIIFDAYCGNIEWNKLGDYTDGMKYVTEMDKTFEIFKERELLVDFTLMMHDPIAIQTDYGKFNWDFGDYNYLDNSITPAPYCYTTIPGVNNPVDMFMNEESLKYIKQKYRYMMSRFGYSTDIYMYTLLSEPWHIAQDFTDESKQLINDYWLQYPNGQDYQQVIADIGDDVEFNVVYDSISLEGDKAREAVQNFHNVLSNYIKYDLQRNSINLLGAIGHIPEPNSIETRIGNIPDLSWSLASIDVIGISEYDKVPELMHKSGSNTYGLRFGLLNDSLQKPVILVETDLGDGTQSCTFNEQAVMVANRLGTSGCGGFNIWSTYGAYAPVLPKIVKVSNMMNSDFVANVLSEAGGDWEHQSSLWKVRVKNPNEQNRNVDLREVQFIKSQNKTIGFGSLYNRQFNVQNYADTSDSDYSNCHIDYNNGVYPTYEYGYMFYDGWIPKDIAWNKKKKLKVEKLKKKTDYLVKYYDYSTLAYRPFSDHVTKSSSSGKLKIKHPILSWGLDNHDIEPIYFFTVEEISTGKSSTMVLPDLEKNEIRESKLYPNPSNGKFTLEYTNFILSYKILDISGRLIKEVDDLPRKSNVLIVEENLKPGSYVIFINDTNHFKFVIL